MNPNMSICSRLNPRLLVQAEVGLDPLHWANMSNIFLSPSLLHGLIVIVCVCVFFFFFFFFFCNRLK